MNTPPNKMLTPDTKILTPDAETRTPPKKMRPPNTETLPPAPKTHTPSPKICPSPKKMLTPDEETRTPQNKIRPAPKKILTSDKKDTFFTKFLKKHFEIQKKLYFCSSKIIRMFKHQRIMKESQNEKQGHTTKIKRLTGNERFCESASK